MPQYWVSGTMEEDYRVLVDADTPEEAYAFAQSGGSFEDTESLNRDRSFIPFDWSPSEGVEEFGTVELAEDNDDGDEYADADPPF